MNFCKHLDSTSWNLKTLSEITLYNKVSVRHRNRCRGEQKRAESRNLSPASVAIIPVSPTVGPIFVVGPVKSCRAETHISSEEPKLKSAVRASNLRRVIKTTLLGASRVHLHPGTSSTRKTTHTSYTAHSLRPNCTIVRIGEPSNGRDYALPGNCHVAAVLRARAHQHARPCHVT